MECFGLSSQVDRLKTLNGELSCGTTAVVALVYGGRLFVANVGERRALLCRTDKDGVLRVLQLSVDHNLSNEDELLRLQQLGLDIERMKLGEQSYFYCSPHNFYAMSDFCHCSSNFQSTG